MKNNRRIILVEFNELSPQLMTRFMTAGHLPNFQRLHDESHVYITEATERGWDLNPWVQWVTVHSGLNYEEHGISELDEGGKLTQQRVWDVVSDAGSAVWVCGSMNVAYHRPVNGFVMPDPWTTKIPPHPKELVPFFDFVKQHVLERSTRKAPLSWRAYLRFLGFMASHGLSGETIAAFARQLLAERTTDQYWKRATLLDKLQFDVFRWYYRKARPQFATFFSNSTAHFQHYYWREMEPHLFKIQPTPQQRAARENAILYGYKEMDKLLARLMALADSNTIVMFATAISQKPCLIYEEQGGKVLYRPCDFSKLMSFADVTEPHTVAPVMAEVFNIHLENEQDAARVETKLQSLRVEGRPAMQIQRQGVMMHVKCQVHEQLPAGARVESASGRHAMSFFELFYQMDDLKSGMHDPDGMLWIRMPDKQFTPASGKVPLAAVAPTILRLLSLPSPAHMKASPLAV